MSGPGNSSHRMYGIADGSGSVISARIYVRRDGDSVRVWGIRSATGRLELAPQQMMFDEWRGKIPEGNSIWTFSGAVIGRSGFADMAMINEPVPPRIASQIEAWPS